jgi:ankyrin repeat protein
MNMNKIIGEAFLSRRPAPIDLCSPDENVRKRLREACQRGHLDKVIELCSLPGININGATMLDDYCATVLHKACSWGRLNIVKYLCSLPEVNINIRDSFGNMPVQCAIINGHIWVVKYLLKRPGVNATDVLTFRDNNGWTPLHYSCCFGHPTMTKYFCSFPSVDVNAVTPDGKTPLHLACKHGNLEDVRILCLSGRVLNQ